jgi:hypothetical protein
MILRTMLGAAILAVALVILVAGLEQSAPNATRAVIGARQVWCSQDSRFVATSHSGWLPTAGCLYPPPVPEVRR